MLKVINISVPEMSQEKAEEVHAGILSLMHSVGIDDFCVEISEEDEKQLILELERGEITTEMIEEQADRFNGEESWAEVAVDNFKTVMAKGKDKAHG